MGLITFFFVVAFALLYLSRSLDKKPDFIDKAAAKMSENIDNLALWGVIYGFVAAIFVLISENTGLDIVVRLFANVMLIVMALPFCAEKIFTKVEGKLNAAVLENLRDLISSMVRKEKAIGYTGAASAVVLFAVMFR